MLQSPNNGYIILPYRINILAIHETNRFLQQEKRAFFLQHSLNRENPILLGENPITTTFDFCRHKNNKSVTQIGLYWLQARYQNHTVAKTIAIRQLGPVNDDIHNSSYKLQLKVSPCFYDTLLQSYNSQEKYKKDNDCAFALNMLLRYFRWLLISQTLRFLILQLVLRSEWTIGS